MFNGRKNNWGYPRIEDYGPFPFPDPFVTETGKPMSENRPKPLLKWIWSFFLK